MSAHFGTPCKMLEAIAIIKVTLNNKSMCVLYSFEGVTWETDFVIHVGGLFGTYQCPKEC